MQAKKANGYVAWSLIFFHQHREGGDFFSPLCPLCLDFYLCADIVSKPAGRRTALAPKPSPDPAHSPLSPGL